MRAWPSAIAGGTVLACLIWLTWQAGGYFAADYLTAGAVVFATGGLLLIVHVPRYRLSTEALVGFGALAAYAAWTGLSSAWSPFPDGALESMQRAIVHAGIFGLALLAAGSGRYARHLVWAVLAVIGIIVLAGLASRLFPDLLQENIDLRGGEPYRLAYPWTYWNAAGVVAAMGGVLAGGLAADPRTAIHIRALTAGIAVLMLVAMYLSLSRGAWLALIVGVVVLFVIGANRGSLLLTAAIVGLGTTLAILRLRGYPALTTDPMAGVGQESAGHAYAPQLLLFAVVAAAGQFVVVHASESVMPALRRGVKPFGIAVAVVAALFALLAYGARGDAVEGRAYDAGDAVAEWLSDQWQDFLRPAQFSGHGAARLVTSRGSRSDAWRVAFGAFGDHPLIGEGGASYEQRWIRDREVGESMRNAHSLEFETLAELGLVGAALLLAFLGSLVAAVVRSRRRPGALARSQVAAVAAACSVWLAHSLIDWDWQMTALTGLALVLASAMYPYGQRRTRQRRVPVIGQRTPR